MTLRLRMYRALEPMGRMTALNAFLAVAIITSIAIAVLETEPTLGYAEPLFTGAERGFTVLFALEYLLRLWVAPEDPRYAHRVVGRLRWMASPTALIDLLVLAPALLLGAFTPVYLLRLLRLLRIVRLTRFGRFSRAWALISAVFASRRYELLVALIVGVLALLVSATLLYLVEGPVQPDKFGSIPRALWWAVVTLTTIGYGDVFPITPLGRVLAGVTAVFGIGLIAAPTGILAGAFSEAVQRHRESLMTESERGDA